MVDYREVNQLLNVSELASVSEYVVSTVEWKNSMQKSIIYDSPSCLMKVLKLSLYITPIGVYRFLACPFGISTAPGEYQARMAHQILQEFYLNGAVVY